MVIAVGLVLAGLLLASEALAAEFEAPPAAFQTVPRPADGETVSANPPCFVFPAAAIHEAYVVEVSADPAFPAAATKRLASPYMLAVPAEPLPTGRYHWRWRPGKPEDGATTWSPVRAFAVTDDAPKVPFPDIAALIKRIGASRPRVAVTAAELADVRKRALERYGQAWLADVRKTAERLRDKALLPEPDFLPDSKDPRRIEVYQKTFQTTRPFFGEMARLAENYLLTGDELSGLEAKRRLLHTLSWNPRGSTSLGHNDEPATEVVRYGPTVFDRVYPLLTADEKRRCLDCLLVRMEEMRGLWKRRPFEKNPYESHNMGYYLPDMLEACLALAGEAPVDEMLRYVMLQLWSPFYPPYGGADGGWCEGPSYWSWSTSVFAKTYWLVERATAVPVHLRSHVRQMPFYKLYGNPPYFKMSPFGDGQEGPALGGNTMAMLAALYQNPYAKWYADYKKEGLGSLAGLLFDAPSVTAKPPYDLPQGRAFYDVGLAAMHTVLPDPTSNVALLLRSSPFGSISHAFADQNTFVLDAYGEPLIIASGYYQLYGHPHHAEWTRQTKASNSVLVNGEGQPVRDWNAKGRLATFRTTAAGDYTVGDAKQAYGGKLTRFDRRVVFLRPIHTGGEPIIVIRDELAAPKPATFQFLLHALNRMDVDAPKQRVTIAKGASRCRVDYLAPTGLTFDQHDRFTKPPFRPAPNQWHLTASTVEPASVASSLIVLQPYRDDGSGTLLTPQIETQPGYVGVRLTAADRTILVLFQADGAAADAQAASLCIVGGEVRSAVLFEGTKLAHGGGTLLESDGMAAVSCARYGRQRHLVSSDGPRGTRLACRTGILSGTGPRMDSRPTTETWVQGDGLFLRAVGEGSIPAFKPLEAPGQTPAPFEVARYDHVQRLVARVQTPGPTGVYQAHVTLSNGDSGHLPVTLAAGPALARKALAPQQQTVKLTLPVANLGGGRELTIAADESRGGQLVVHHAAIERAFGVNLVPNGSFEEVADGVPVGWQAMSISNNAQCAIASADGGRNGGRCIQVTCTQATGGTFGAILAWPGVAPSDVDRKFRMGCWVKTDATSVAGVQVTSANWQWWKNTERLKDRKDWAETTLDFVLPAGENITHLRLHMAAEKTGAVLLVDDVSLAELPMP